MTHLFRLEFGADVQMPVEILEALASGELLDTSWHNDVCPSFFHRDADQISSATDERDLRLWVNPVNPDDREYRDAPRFIVHRLDQDCVLYEGEDVTAALTALRAEAALVMAQRLQEAR